MSRLLLRSSSVVLAAMLSSGTLSWAQEERSDPRLAVPAISLPDDLALVLGPHRQGRSARSGDGSVRLYLPMAGELVPFLELGELPSNRCVELPDPFEENSVWLFEGETVALLVVTPDSASLLEWNASQSCLALAWELGRPQLPESCAELVDAEYTFAEEGSGQPSERTWDGDWLSASPGSETLRLDATHFALLAEDGSHVASASIPAGEGSTGRHRVTLLGCGEGSVWIQADLEAEAGQVDGEGDFSTFFVAELSETPSTFSVTDESERHWSQGAVCPTFEESSRGTETLATYAVPGAELRFESDRQESQSSSSVFCIDDVHEGYGAQAESEERWSWSWSVDGFELGAGGVENAGTSTECDSLAVFQVGLESED